MKKIIMICALICALHATATQFNHDFQRRFGPDSAIYNEPLYFSKRSLSKNRDKRPRRRSYREQIRTRMHREDAKQRG